MFIENAYDEYNDDEEISSLLWNPIAIRHAIRAFVFALNNTDENGLNLNIELPLGSLSKELLNETIKAFGNDTDMSNVALTYEKKFKIRLRP